MLIAQIFAILDHMDTSNLPGRTNLTTQEAAALVEMNPWQLLRLAKAGKVWGAIKPRTGRGLGQGTQWRFKRADFLAWKENLESPVPVFREMRRSPKAGNQTE